jgi:hypothetical protein
MSNPKCFKCAKTVYPLEAVKFSDRVVLHKQCVACQECNVRLTLASGKVHETMGIFCERDWVARGLGTVGVKGNAGNDDIQIAAAKRAEGVRREATMSGSKEIQGGQAGQQKNSQAADLRDVNAANAQKVLRDAASGSKEIQGAQAGQATNSQTSF